MKKLSPEQIQELIRDYAEGEPVPSLAVTYKISKGAVYYQLRSFPKKKENPKGYLDHVKNHIFDLTQKIEKGYFTKEQVPYAQAEIGRLKNWLKKDRSSLPSDPFVLS